MDVPLLTVTGLACRRGGALLFRDIDLRLMPGRLIWLRGPNGSGKTTLMRTLAGLTQPEHGHVHWREGLVPAHRLLYLGHRNGLKEDFSAVEALQALAMLGGQEQSQLAVRHALHRLGVPARREVPVRRLSQGQQRRVALARLALAPHPHLWVLDEPYDALDADGIARVDALLHEQLARGGAVLLSSHVLPSPSAPAGDVIDLAVGRSAA